MLENIFKQANDLSEGYKMKARIKALNAAYVAGEISVELYRVKSKCVLSALDWQRRIKYENLLYVTV